MVFSKYGYVGMIIFLNMWGGIGSLHGQPYLVEKENGERMVDVVTLDSSFVLDIRYASKNNFTGEQMYECGRCYLREPVAELLLQAHQEFKKNGYRIKLFDCYRPRSIQYKLWDAKPDPRYVARPWKGSVHNRGGAVDMTLIDSLGNEIDMGTTYDFFGPEAHQDNKNLPEEVLRNRSILTETMMKYQFSPIRTEWWHFDFWKNKLYPLSDLVWDCN